MYLAQHLFDIFLNHDCKVCCTLAKVESEQMLSQQAPKRFERASIAHLHLYKTPISSLQDNPFGFTSQFFAVNTKKNTNTKLTMAPFALNTQHQSSVAFSSKDFIAAKVL